MTSPQEIFDQYQESVKQLAEADPVAAYEINFRFSGALRDKIDELVERMREMEGASDKPPTDKTVIDRLFTRLYETSNRELIARLEDDLLFIARRVGWRTRRAIRQKIKEMPGRVRKDVQQIVEQMLAQIASLLSEGQPSSGQSPQPLENKQGLSGEKIPAGHRKDRTLV